MLCPAGRVLQIGTVHNLGQNFAKAFDITFENKKGNQEHIWTTSYGISGRGIAAVLIAHGDDNGIVLPIRIAPIQIVIVPVPYKGKEQEVNRACTDIETLLREAGYRVKLDLRSELTPGNKFYYWELRGVPIRVEIGPRDLKNKEITIARRDILKKQTWKTDEAATGIKIIADQINENLKTQAKETMNKRIFRVSRLSEAKSLLKNKAGIIEVPWCGKEDCGHKLEETR